MTDRITQCDVVDCCEDCPRYADDCDGDKYLDRYPTMHEYAEGKRVNPKLTDLISRADVFEIIDKAFSQPMRDGVTLYTDICLMLNALPTHANSRSTHERDLISRADAIKAVQNVVLDAEAIEALKTLPSADAVQGDECDHCVYKWGMKGGAE